MQYLRLLATQQAESKNREVSLAFYDLGQLLPMQSSRLFIATVDQQSWFILSQVGMRKDASKGDRSTGLDVP